MAQVVGLLKFAALTVVSYFVFGILGEYSALGILYATGNNDLVGWVVYGLGIAIAVGAAVFAWGRRRAGRPLSAVQRGALAGFAAFFCWQWTVGGTPDWNPVPILIGFSICMGCGVFILRVPSVAAGARTPDRESAFEQRNRADGVG